MNERPHLNMQLLEHTGVRHCVTRSGGRTMCNKNISAEMWMSAKGTRGADGLVGTIQKDCLVTCIKCIVNTFYILAGYTQQYFGGDFVWKPRP